jgi:hypothetical protein
MYVGAIILERERERERYLQKKNKMRLRREWHSKPRLDPLVELPLPPLSADIIW